ncbi:BRO1-like domain-containing protein [Sodiomyces alkalinus F11]|uniref:BRO domain-containing protein 1 n=1 Tax=Sodiomyces alkalinus (strain CBS 110278 / VKM F-3762 / F11) TaxID=1314773 RepID=A0A3N2Q174_SODAK|nr:BRO1-like domain-containing protein [Sodiomyces alkalinus F11]ROT40511.1 BRO1-like domain-containing protein [Sodiomyces alkalinus F11]
MTQSPMISVPLKATNEIDWVTPLKNYIRNTYGDDPERYTEECATLNRLRQDVRGAGKDSTSGRDMLYRYYGQLELLDLRFPVDEHHIKISFTWFDAFTHKATSQYSLAFEKASIIFNIAAVLSCYAAHQSRSEESGLKTAYHNFQASAGMFTYINENFLHAPSADLSRDTVKNLISINLAQAQEVFLEKQAADHKKVGLLAKLASQASTLYTQAVEGIQENVTKAIFERVWLLMVQIKASFFSSMAQYYQALADIESNQHGAAVARLEAAEKSAKEAGRLATSFPSSCPPGSNLSSDTGAILAEATKRHLSTVQDKLREMVRDNDYIYQQSVPAEASLAPVGKLPAAKPIPVSELYAGQDIQRITGPDLFAKIVPFAVTEMASLYDEEKAKLIRAETEKVDLANGELAASFDYLKLPGALQILKGGFDQEILPDDDFKTWCDDVADQENPAAIFETLRSEKETIVSLLDKSTKHLDMEESVCEKMRSKYESEWSQQPSSRLTTTLRGDIRNYREALEEASRSDAQLLAKLRQNEGEFDEMRTAAANGEVDALFQRAVNKARVKSSSATSPMSNEPNLLDADFEEVGPSVLDQIRHVEDIMKKLHLVKRERNQTLKDLKEKVHNDDISEILILNKKNISNYEQQLFQSELEKFRPLQNRLLQASQKQSSFMKELNSAFNTLLQDKRVRAEQSKYEAVQRQRASAINRYKRAYQEFLDLIAGLQSAKRWYEEMRETVESLEKNVMAFVNNRRSEGAQLLDQIEKDRASRKDAQAEVERERLRELMDRMSMEPKSSTPQPGKNSSGRPTPAPLNLGSNTSSGSIPRYPHTNFQGQYQVPQSPPATQIPGMQQYPSFAPPPNSQSFASQSTSSTYGQPTYNPSQYGRTPGPTSPPPHQSTFGPAVLRGPASPPPNQTTFGQTQPLPHQQPYGGYPGPQQHQAGHSHSSSQSFVPPGFVPPPPPPGPPPLGPQQTFYGENFQQPQQTPVGQHGSYHGSYPQGSHTQGSQPGPSNDPWAGLSAWK